MSFSILLRMFVRKSTFQTQIFSKCYFFERIHSTVLKFRIVVLLSRSPAPSIYKIRLSESEMKETKGNMFTIYHFIDRLHSGDTHNFGCKCKSFVTLLKPKKKLAHQKCRTAVRCPNRNVSSYTF